MQVEIILKSSREPADDDLYQRYKHHEETDVNVMCDYGHKVQAHSSVLGPLSLFFKNTIEYYSHMNIPGGKTIFTTIAAEKRHLEFVFELAYLCKVVVPLEDFQPILQLGKELQFNDWRSTSTLENASANAVQVDCYDFFMGSVGYRTNIETAGVLARFPKSISLQPPSAESSHAGQDYNPQVDQHTRTEDDEESSSRPKKSKTCNDSVDPVSVGSVMDTELQNCSSSLINSTNDSGFGNFYANSVDMDGCSFMEYSMNKSLANLQLNGPVLPLQAEVCTNENPNPEESGEMRIDPVEKNATKECKIDFPRGHVSGMLSEIAEKLSVVPCQDMATDEVLDMSSYSTGMISYPENIDDHPEQGSMKDMETVPSLPETVNVESIDSTKPHLTAVISNLENLDGHSEQGLMKEVETSLAPSETVNGESIDSIKPHSTAVISDLENLDDHPEQGSLQEVETAPALPEKVNGESIDSIKPHSNAVISNLDNLDDHHEQGSLQEVETAPALPETVNGERIDSIMPHSTAMISNLDDHPEQGSTKEVETVPSLPDTVNGESTDSTVPRPKESRFFVTSGGSQSNYAYDTACKFQKILRATSSIGSNVEGSNDQKETETPYAEQEPSLQECNFIDVDKWQVESSNAVNLATAKITAFIETMEGSYDRPRYIGEDLSFRPSVDEELEVQVSKSVSEENTILSPSLNPNTVPGSPETDANEVFSVAQPRASPANDNGYVSDVCSSDINPTFQVLTEMFHKTGSNLTDGIQVSQIPHHDSAGNSASGDFFPGEKTPKLQPESINEPVEDVRMSIFKSPMLFPTMSISERKYLLKSAPPQNIRNFVTVPAGINSCVFNGETSYYNNNDRSNTSANNTNLLSKLHSNHGQAGVSIPPMGISSNSQLSLSYTNLQCNLAMSNTSKNEFCVLNNVCSSILKNPDVMFGHTQADSMTVGVPSQVGGVYTRAQYQSYLNQGTVNPKQERKRRATISSSNPLPAKAKRVTKPQSQLNTTAGRVARRTFPQEKQMKPIEEINTSLVMQPNVTVGGSSALDSFLPDENSSDDEVPTCEPPDFSLDCLPSAGADSTQNQPLEGNLLASLNQHEKQKKKEDPVIRRNRYILRQKSCGKVFEHNCMLCNREFAGKGALTAHYKKCGKTDGVPFVQGAKKTGAKQKKKKFELHNAQDHTCQTCRICFASLDLLNAHILNNCDQGGPSHILHEVEKMAKQDTTKPERFMVNRQMKAGKEYESCLNCGHQFGKGGPLARHTKTCMG